MIQFHTRIPNHFDLPRRISRLGELAYNLWWTWQPEAARLFGKLDYDLWQRLGHNPIRLLREIDDLLQRAIGCGAIVDPVIAAHKRITSSVVASIQAVTTEHEAVIVD